MESVSPRREFAWTRLPAVRPLTVLQPLFLCAFYILLLAPIALVVASSFSNTRYLTFPPQGFTMRWYYVFWTSSEFRQAFISSLRLAGSATGCALLLGGSAAFAIDRYRFPGRTIVQLALLSPLVIPLMVLGIALLQFLSLLGWAKTFASLLLGHLVITMPYVVRTLLAALSGFNRSIEEAALNLGANPVQALWYVTLPNLRSGFLAAAIFAFITSFGDLSIAIFLAGAQNTTLPVRLFQYVEYAYDPTITAISTVIVVLTLLLIVTLDWVMGLERLV